ncbi:thiamine phosphate synthase [Acetobacter orientalis]|uniref:thiamine phosphate synthase n=1 Tax=Acetobacter orientalis TaxID=146474 RepID=UPI0039E9C787
MTAYDIYLATPALRDADAFLPKLAQGLATLPPAAVLLRLADAPEPQLVSLIQKILPVVQGQDIAVLLEDRPALAKKTGCDGVHLSPRFAGGSVRDVRKLLGDDLQLGVAVGVSRDAAMRAGEEGADYICFGAGGAPADAEDSLPGTPEPTPVELAKWWCLVMELPAVIEVPEPAQLAQVAASGADFMMPAITFWDTPQAWHIPA